MSRYLTSAYLGACRRLLAHYERALLEGPLPYDFVPRCPLCTVSRHCDTCPWLRFEGHACLKAARRFRTYRRGGMVALRAGESRIWTEQAIARLRRWIARLETELAEEDS